MQAWIVFLRGINVGGRNRLPMKTLVTLFDSLGYASVRTYIQSGNVAFLAREKSAERLAADIQDKICNEIAFTPSVILLTLDRLHAAIDENPFPDAVDEPASLHLFFPQQAIGQIDETRLAQLKNSTERYALVNNVFYLHAPAGIARSKLAVNVEKIFGMQATSRNFRTVLKTAALAADISGHDHNAG